MEVKVIQELKPYSQMQLIEWLSQEETSKNIIESLILMNILKKLTYNLAKPELIDLLDVEEFEEIENSLNNMYVFNYVGMVMIGKVCFFIYPKYIKNIDEDIKNGYKKFKQILSVIRKYKGKEQVQIISGTEDITEFNLLSFTLDMLQDYYENGIYSNNKVVIEENGFGEILWEKTINEQNMYFSNNLPIYLEPYTVNNVVNQNDIFRRLHMSIITECCKNTKDIIEVLEISPVFLSDEYLDDFGSEEHLKYLLKQEITQQFNTRKQSLLYKMLYYIERDKSNKSSEKISFIGTNSFNLVWEDVCACVMGNCLNRTLYELDLKSYGDKKSSDMLIDLIPKPKWKHSESGKEHEAKKTLTPDLISVSNGKLSIYDAKYYNIQLNERGVRKQPGVGDVTKQYLYELAYRKLADVNKLKIERNAFLMPSDENEEEVIGLASMELFHIYDSNNFFKDIEVILIPCEKIFKKYLYN